MKRIISLLLLLSLLIAMPIEALAQNEDNPKTAVYEVAYEIPTSIFSSENGDDRAYAKYEVKVTADYVENKGTMEITLKNALPSAGMTEDTENFEENVKKSLTSHGIATFDIDYNTGVPEISWVTKNFKWENDMFYFKNSGWEGTVKGSTVHGVSTYMGIDCWESSSHKAVFYFKILEIANISYADGTKKTHYSSSKFLEDEGHRLETKNAPAPHSPNLPTFDIPAFILPSGEKVQIGKDGKITKDSPLPPTGSTPDASKPIKEGPGDINAPKDPVAPKTSDAIGDSITANETEKKPETPISPKDSFINEWPGVKAGFDSSSITFECSENFGIDEIYLEGKRPWIRIVKDGSASIGVDNNDEIKTTTAKWYIKDGKEGSKDLVIYNIDTGLVDVIISQSTLNILDDGSLKLTSPTRLGDTYAGSIYYPVGINPKETAKPDNKPGMATPSYNFTDVPSDAWYANEVRAVSSAGIIAGKGKGQFAPNDYVTYAESYKLAAMVHARLTGENQEFVKGSPWYQGYVDYLKRHQIFPELLNSQDPSSQITREHFAVVMSGALSSFTQTELNKNNVPLGSIPDVGVSSNYANEIYSLYKAGIMVGSDKQGNFKPHSKIVRSEVSAIIHRFIAPDQRRTFKVTTGGDLTSFVPNGYSWTVEQTEGYGRADWTSGKYVREDGKAVIYIDSATSPDSFTYYCHAMAQNGRDAWTSYGYTYSTEYSDAFVNGNLADDPTNGLKFVWIGSGELTIDADWIDDSLGASPTGVYKLVREKR